MNRDDPVLISLDDSLKLFEQCVRETTIAILELKAVVTQPFEITNVSPIPRTINCLLNANGSKYKSHLLLSIELSGLESLLPMEDSEFQKDAFGEMANVISGMFLRNHDFLGKFGHLRLEPPLISETPIKSKKEWCISGAIEVNQIPIQMYFFLRPVEESLKFTFA